jgi:exosortase A-associated hydrolase 2
VNRAAPFELFFLPARAGERLCVFHPPAAGTPKGAVVYFHPFAEEMNKSRRMAALQSRRLAQRGYAVLQMDLYGCGDSSGDFGDASWDIWKEDAALAVQYVKQRVSGPVWLWGLRLGATLALDFARGSAERFEGYLLWQPVASGEAYMTQFLRLQVANDMLAGSEKTTTQRLREDLQAAGMLEIAGYRLSRRMADAVDALRLSDLAPRDEAPVCWLEVVSGAAGSVPPASRRVADAWAARGRTPEIRTVAGEPFWHTTEIAECAALIDETTGMMAGVPA